MARDTGMSKEFFVGMFVAAGIAVFIFFIFAVGSFSGPSKTVKIEFGYVDGLQSNNSVLYSGYTVGKVDNVEIINGPPVRLIATISIPKDLPVYHNSEFLITSAGLIGDKVIDILPPLKPGEPVKENQILKGDDPMILSKVFGKVGRMFGGEGNSEVKGMLENAVQITEDLAEFSSTLKKISTGNEAELDKMVKNLSEGSDHIPSLLERADRTVLSLDKLAKDLSAISEENRPEIKAMIHNLNTTSENIEDFSATIKKSPWKIFWKSKEKTDKKKKSKRK